MKPQSAVFTHKSRRQTPAGECWQPSQGGCREVPSASPGPNQPNEDASTAAFASRTSVVLPSCGVQYAFTPPSRIESMLAHGYGPAERLKNHACIHGHARASVVNAWPGAVCWWRVESCLACGAVRPRVPRSTQSLVWVVALCKLTLNGR